MPIPKTLLFLCFIIPFSFATNSPSAYEMLEEFNFPRGILPEGVQSYTLRPDGWFEVLLWGDCDFQVEGGYPLKYRRRVTGRVDSGVLRDLNGVSVKVLFVWVGINQVIRSDSTLYFYVGPFSASFPVTNFEECPTCRCGTACIGEAAAAALSADS
ncbi:uncharacterized protein M6B38_273185 [Iris pallida]|uniref:Uncharacterized protein n=1 Tax=Iris pallida TaxID=29817 RepID=A0AAX6I4T9_IRIPA|nr:uncharacterized protein M6B38_273185 [Iris pallida]